MGVFMSTDTREQLHCLSHGEYFKFSSEMDKGCPYCKAEQARQDNAQYLKKTRFNLDSIESMVVQCEIHGEQTLNVPKMLADRFKHCPLCAKNNNAATLKVEIEKHVKQAMIAGGLPENCLGHSFAAVDRSRSAKQTAIIERLIKYIQDLIAQGSSTGAKNIMLCGNMGTGKTYFATILLQNIVRRSYEASRSHVNDIQLKGGLAVQFLSEQTLQSAITATWANNAAETTQQLYQRLSRKAILCLDDVGTVTGTQTHLLDAYAYIFDERYKRNLPTIITSNMTHEGLRLAIGARAADRFLEKNRIIVANFDWQGYRTAQVGTDEIEIF